MTDKEKESSKKNKKKEAWKTDSFDGALLFLLLLTRIGGHPDDFSASQIQENPLYDFNKYSSQTFKRNSQTIANKVKKYEDKGTGLSEEFKRFIGKVLKEKADIFDGCEVKNFDEDDDKGEDYNPNEDDDDITHISNVVDEESLSDLVQDNRFNTNPNPQPPIDTANICVGNRTRKPTIKESAQKKEPKPMSSGVTTTNNTPKTGSYLLDYADGRIIGVYPLPSGWDGTFKVGPDQQTVIMSTKISKSMFDAKTILQRHGFDDNNMHVVSLQAAMTNAKKKLSRASDKDHNDEIIWHLPFKVRPKFCDPNGIETNDMYIEEDRAGFEWAYMFMVGLHAKEDIPEGARVVRNRNRGRRGPSTSPRGPAPAAPALPGTNSMVEDGSEEEDDNRGDPRPRLGLFGR